MLHVGCVQLAIRLSVLPVEAGWTCCVGGDFVDAMYIGQQVEHLWKVSVSNDCWLCNLTARGGVLLPDSANSSCLRHQDSVKNMPFAQQSPT